jgi:hypothetical protein
MRTNEVARFLIAAGMAAPSADNMQPWRFQVEGNELVLKFDADRMGNVSFPLNHPATMITMGAVIENLAEAIKLLRMQVDLKPAIPTLQPYDFLRVGLTESDVTTSPYDAPLFTRHTNRLPYSTVPLPQAIRTGPCSDSQGDTKIQFIESKEEIRRIAALVRDASQVRFQTQELHEWFSASLRFSKDEVERGDGLDVATFDLPPGGRAFMRLLMASWRNMALFNRIGGYRMMAGIEAASITKAGAIVAVIGPDTSMGALDAGRLMQRVWIILNQAGLAVQPYYVVSDQLTRLAEGTVPGNLRERVEQLQEHVRSVFTMSGNRQLYMLLRVGKPKREAVRSRRLPLE